MQSSEPLPLTDQSPAPPTTPRRNRPRLWLVIGIGIVVLVAIALGISWLQQSSRLEPQSNAGKVSPSPTPTAAETNQTLTTFQGLRIRLAIPEGFIIEEQSDTAVTLVESTQSMSSVTLSRDSGTVPNHSDYRSCDAVRASPQALPAGAVEMCLSPVFGDDHNAPEVMEIDGALANAYRLSGLNDSGGQYVMVDGPISLAIDASLYTESSVLLDIINSIEWLED